MCSPFPRFVPSIDKPREYRDAAQALRGPHAQNRTNAKISSLANTVATTQLPPETRPPQKPEFRLQPQGSTGRLSGGPLH